MAQDFAQARRYAKLMGILYGVITACELTNTPVVYDAVVNAMKQHCTEYELKKVFSELARYASVVQAMQQQEGK